MSHGSVWKLESVWSLRKVTIVTSIKSARHVANEVWTVCEVYLTVLRVFGAWGVYVECGVRATYSFEYEEWGECKLFIIWAVGEKLLKGVEECLWSVTSFKSGGYFCSYQFVVIPELLHPQVCCHDLVPKILKTRLSQMNYQDLILIFLTVLKICQA